MEVIKTILHPTDFSRQSEYALGLACGLARDHGARLVLLHVVPGEASVNTGWEVSESFAASTTSRTSRVTGKR